MLECVVEFYLMRCRRFLSRTPVFEYQPQVYVYVGSQTAAYGVFWGG